METTIGRIVIYRLTEADVEAVHRRRTTRGSIIERIRQNLWPLGAQAHIGNKVDVGQAFPMLIVRVWTADCVNGQVFLDGNDVLWVSSVLSDFGTDMHGRWHWPELKAAPQAVEGAIKTVFNEDRQARPGCF